jgi:glutathione S-transferase
MIALYHNPMSSASQKVRLCLAEKGLDWESRLIDLRAGEQHAEAYLKINPRGVVPTLIDDSEIVPESTVINEFLEQKYPQVPLLPTSAYDRARVRLWTKQVDDSIHDLGIAVLAFGIAFRQQYIAMGEAGLTLIDKIPDLFKRERRRDLVLHGLQSAHFRAALLRMQQMLREMDAALAEAPWLVGATYTMADLSLLPYVLRMRELGLGDLISRYPNVSAWWERCVARDSFAKAISAWQDEKALTFMASAGGRATGAVLAILEAQ